MFTPAENMQFRLGGHSLKVWVHAGYFRYRKDFAFWKAGV
jgi:hypothetical protein